MKRLIAVVALSLLAACTQIDTGNVGVESTFGQVKADVLMPGVYFTLFKRVDEVSAKENVIELNDLKPKTSDNVTLADLDVNVYYKIGAPNAAKILTKYAGDAGKNGDGDLVVGYGLVTRLARESAYTAATKHHSSDAHTKRVEIAASIRESLQKELDTDAGKGFFEITNVAVRNLVTDLGLERSIKDAAQVEFQIRQKKQEIELAKAEADRKKIEAQGVANANDIVARSITPNLIEMRRVEMTEKFADKGTHTVLLPQGTQPLIQVK